jgi:antitoxin VapB
MDLELPGDEALINPDGSRLVIEPLARPLLTRLLSSWDPIDVAWPDLEDRRPEPADLAEP